MAKITLIPSPRIVLPRYNTGIGGRTTDAAPFNVWFDEMFPDATKKYGPGFLEGRHEDVDGFTIYTPIELNVDAWASALGGRKDLGLQVVWYPPEQTWYFYDYRAGGVGAYCPVSEQKLQVLLSSYLMRCAEECERSVDIQPLVSTFRTTESLKTVTERAKVILEADRSFFSGSQGKSRMVDGRIIEANATPSYIQFVKKAIVSQPESKLTIADAFEGYYRFCKDLGEPPLTRADFKDLVSQVIREEFRLGVRHDILDERGKQQHGWVGIGCSIGRN